MRLFKNKYSFKIFLQTFICLAFFNFVLAAPTITLTPKTQNIKQGENATIRITTTGASKCTVSGGRYDKNNTIVNGPVLLTPSQTSTFTFECIATDNSTSTATSSVSVLGTVAAPTSVNTSNGTVNANNGNAAGSGSSASSPRAPSVPYNNDTIRKEAEAICAAYSGYTSVYNAVSGGGGGSSVPVDLTQLRPYLISIDRNSQLTANEIRNENMIRYCRETINMAKASEKLAQDSAKQLKTIADDCTADSKCLLSRVYKSDLQNEVDRLKNFPIQGRELAKILAESDQRGGIKYMQNYNPEEIKKCDQARASGRNPIECIPTMMANEDMMTSEYFAAEKRIAARQTGLARDFADGNGVIGKRTCTETYSGADPTQVNWYDKDCNPTSVKSQPSLINQEVLRQITALPFTQAYSPANVLGADPAIGNINSRIQSGNLIDPDISPSFGSASQQGGSTGSSGNGTLKDADANYKKLVSNIEVITTLYDVAKAAYASSTSICKTLPVQTRNDTVTRVDAAKKTYTDYSTNLKAAWDKASSTPNESHINLITQINFDLKDKYTQTLITQVYDAVKSLLQACATAASSAPTT